MMFDYKLEQVEVDYREIQAFAEEALQTELSVEDIVEFFEDTATEIITDCAENYAQINDLSEEESLELTESAIEEDLEEVVVEITKDFVNALIDDIEMTTERLEDSVKNLKRF